MKPPIILGSAPSSGSTLLRVLLGRHPSIVAGGEVGLFDKRALLAEPMSAYRQSIQSWLDQGYPGNFLGPSSELFEDLDNYPWTWESVRRMCLSASDYPSMLEKFHRRNMEAKGAERWLDKCPSNIYCFDLISTLYPSARFVHIIRDGRDCVVSYCRRGGSPLKAVGRWFFATLCGIQYRGWENYLEIRYEELVRQPDVVLRQVCEFLNEPYSPSMFAPEPRSANANKGWRYSASDPVQAGSVKQYEREMTDYQRSMFKQVEISVYGARLLYKGSRAPGIHSPIALQQLLGYGAECFADAPTLNHNQLDRSWYEFDKHKSWMRRRYQTDIEPEIQLKYHPTII
jgi:Sulfotransferase family